MRSLVGGLIALMCVVNPPQASAQSDLPPARWELALAVQTGIPGGDVKVGEFTFRGTRLRLHEDLGVDLSKAVELRVGYHLTPRDTLQFSFQTLFLDGTTTLRDDVSFNGATLAGGTTLRTRPQFYRASLAYEHTLLPLGEGGRLAGSVGLTYVHLDFRLQGTLAANSPGTETKEDFWKQELPVPLVGLRADYPLTDHLGLTASLAAGYLPWLDSLRSEGGEPVKLTQAHTDASLGLSYALTPALSVEGGYRYTYFFQHEKNREDDNRFLLSDHAVVLGFAYRF